MQTGRAGDGQSWAERVKAGIDEEFQQDRPAKHHRSQSRRHEQRPTLPFPLKDSEGRLASISQLYEHVEEQPAARHNVAGRGIMHLHPEMLLGKATCLRNQVTCMIAEYHLTSSAQGPSSLSPILPVEAAALLPPIKNYVLGVAFEGTRDVRVMDRARTLQVAAWLHWLDMAAGEVEGFYALVCRRTPTLLSNSNQFKGIFYGQLTNFNCPRTHEYWKTDSTQPAKYFKSI